MRSAAVVVAVLSRAYLGSAAPPRSARWHCGPKRGGDEQAGDARFRLLAGIGDLLELAQNPRMLGQAARHLTLLGLPHGWAVLAPDGRYETEGTVGGQFWHVVGCVGSNRATSTSSCPRSACYRPTARSELPQDRFEDPVAEEDVPRESPVHPRGSPHQLTSRTGLTSRRAGTSGKSERRERVGDVRRRRHTG